jgi:hypothetical protein
MGRPPLRFLVAFAILALAACGPEEPPPPDVFANFASSGRIVGGDCAYIEVLGAAAQSAGVNVERGGPIVLAAIEGLSQDAACDEVQQQAVQRLIEAAGREPELRERPPPTLNTAVDDAARFAARYRPYLRYVRR